MSMWNNIKMDLSEIRIGCMHWIKLAQDEFYWLSVVETDMNLRVP